MEQLKKHLQMPFTSTKPAGTATMEGRSTFHTELPTFQAEVQDSMSRLNVYYEVLGHLCGAGTHVGERFVEIFKGTPYMDIALQLNTLSQEVNSCTQSALQHVKDLSRRLLQDLIVVLERSNKNDRTETNLQIVAKCMAMILQAQYQVFTEISTKLHQLHSEPEVTDFLTQFNASSLSHGATIQQSNTYKQSGPGNQQGHTTVGYPGETNVGLQANAQDNQNTSGSGGNDNFGHKKDVCIASEDELNSVIGLLSCGSKSAGVAPTVNQPVNLPPVNLAIPPPPLQDHAFTNPPPDLKQTVFPSSNATPWPAPLEHRASFPLMSLPVGRGSDSNISAQTTLIGQQLGVPSLWAANDVNLHHSWPRHKAGRDWSTFQDSKDSSSDESSNGDSYFALALGADLTSDITASPRRRHSSSGDETPRAENQTEFVLNRPRSIESFQLEPKSTNTWPPKQPWARQQMASQMAEMMSGDPPVNVAPPTPWSDGAPRNYGPTWMQGYQEATGILPYPATSNNNMKPMNASNYPSQR